MYLVKERLPQMKIDSLSNIRVNSSVRMPVFGQRSKEDKLPQNYSNSYSHVPAVKLVPALIALYGMTTLSSCEEDSRFSDMRNFKNSYFDSSVHSEESLSTMGDKTYVFNEHHDSLYKETPDFKYSHTRFMEHGHTTVMGNIERKADGKRLNFINVYNGDNKLESSILKDPATKDVFYVTYSPEGKIIKVHDKNGDDLPSSRYKFIASIVVLILSLGGLLLPEKHSNKQK